MKYLLHVVNDFGVRKEVFDNKDDVLNDICEEYFETSKEDECMIEVINTLRKDGTWQDEWTTITITEVDDNFYVRKDGAECFAHAEVVIPTWNQAGLSLEVVTHHGSNDPVNDWKNIEISCGDNVDGTVNSMITIGGIDEESGAIEALRDFGLQIVKIADKMKAEKD